MPKNRIIRVFFYGLFMDPMALKRMRLKPMNARRACVRGMALRLGERATLAPSPGHRVFGLVMGLTHAEIDVLYSEPSVSAYRPEAVTAELENGKQFPALCFNLPVFPDDHKVNLEYAAKLKAVAQKMKLPARYTNKIGAS